MKKIITMLVVAFITIAVHAQSLDDVLKQHFKAIGQKEVAKTETIKATGKLVQMGIEIPFIMYQKRPGSMRTEGTFQGMTFVQAYNGMDGFTINPFSGSTEPQPLSPDELKSMKVQSDMDGMLWNYEEKGNTLALDGKEDVEGTECYKIKIISKEGDEYWYFIDTDSYMNIKTTSKVMVQGAQVESDTYMSNFMEVSGITMPGKIENRYNGETTVVINIENYEMNVPLEDSLFAPPSK